MACEYSSLERPRYSRPNSSINPNVAAPPMTVRPGGQWTARAVFRFVTFTSATNSRPMSPTPMPTSASLNGRPIVQSLRGSRGRSLIS